MAKDEEGDMPKRKKRAGLARKVGKAYLDRTERKRDEPEVSPLLAKDALTGKGKLYLRQEERGAGTLVVNNSIVVHLNPTAVDYLKMIFEGTSGVGIVKRITKRYKVGSSIVKDDLDTFMEDLKRLEAGDHPMRGRRLEPLTGPYFGPFRADVAITYKRLAEGGKIDDGELNIEDWLKALDKIWDFGIPHICITGGEPTAREDLVEMIDHATSLGMTVGLLTDGERIGSKAFLGRLTDAGLSYIQISIASHDPDVHEKVTGSPHHRKTVNGIRNAIKSGIPVLANIFITKDSEYGLEDTVDFLIGLGIDHITVNPLEAGEESMPDWMHEKALERARKATRGKARVFWFGPVPGSDPRSQEEVEPMGELAMGNLSWGAGRTHIFIQPDGAVMAGRAHGTVLGNILTHSWNMLWYHSVLKEIRGKGLEQRRWKSLQDLGFNGYPLFPGLKVEPEDDEEE